jgi:hypothetical protein
MMGSITAREVIATTIADLEAEQEEAKKELAAAQRKATRLRDRQAEIANELEGLKAALDTLGGPPPPPEPADA